MFHPSITRHLFDTLFVVLCVTAGACSYTDLNATKAEAGYQAQSIQKTSFMERLFNIDFIELVLRHRSFKVDLSSVPPKSRSNNVLNTTHLVDGNFNVCQLLFTVLGPVQLKFCYKHHDLLLSIIPEVSRLAKLECTHITKELRWNCPSIAPYLDRDKFLAYTKEAALVRSIISASMMYLILEFCTNHGHQSCGCRSDSFNHSNKIVTDSRAHSNKQDLVDLIGQVGFSNSNVPSLQDGLPSRKIQNVLQRQGCQANVAFADGLTRTFLDFDDNKILTKAHKILNQNVSPSLKHLSEKRLPDQDLIDLSILKWTKSAVGLHNSFVGRQIVRGATYRQCKCHGLSGACQFQTCWDKLIDMRQISDRLKLIFVESAIPVGVTDLGAPGKPDLYLSKMPRESLKRHHNHINSDLDYLDSNLKSSTAQTMMGRTNSKELLYLYDGPDYCEHLPQAGHPGTHGRYCLPDKHEMQTMGSTFTNKYRSTGGGRLLIRADEIDALGFCADICCKRGTNTELVLKLDRCNCRFKFCCRIECDSCLRQHLLHHCV